MESITLRAFILGDFVTAPIVGSDDVRQGIIIDLRQPLNSSNRNYKIRCESGSVFEVENPVLVPDDNLFGPTATFAMHRRRELLTKLHPDDKMISSFWMFSGL